MNWKKKFEGSGLDLTKYYPEINWEGLRGLRKTSVKIGVVSVKTRKEHFPNTSPESYRYTNRLEIVTVNF
jgi:hypothetical protein